MSGRKKNSKAKKMTRPTRKAKPPAKTTPAPEPNMAHGEDSDVRLKSDIFETDFEILPPEQNVKPSKRASRRTPHNKRRTSASEFELSPDPDADEFELTLDDSGGAMSGICLQSPESGIEIELTQSDFETNFEVKHGRLPPLVIDPFEHLIEARMTRWRLGEGEFGDDLDRAKNMVRTDPDMALAKCRVTLERCLWRFHEKTLGPAGTKPLEQLIRDLARKSTMPRKISALADVVRELGNVGAHPIIDDEDLSHREAQIAMLALVLILEWYERTTNPLAGAPEYCI